jgi:hypothetical protein
VTPPSGGAQNSPWRGVQQANSVPVVVTDKPPLAATKPEQKSAFLCFAIIERHESDRHFFGRSTQFYETRLHFV